VQHPAASKVDEEKTARASTSRLPRVLKSRLPLKSGKQSSLVKPPARSRHVATVGDVSRPCEDSSWSSCADRDAIKNVSASATKLASLSLDEKPSGFQARAGKEPWPLVTRLNVFLAVSKTLLNPYEKPLR